MQKIELDKDFIEKTLVELLNIHSPSGYSDQIVHFVGKKLEKMGVDFTVTRRGAIRATLPGRHNNFDRALTAHLDTLGAMVTRLKENGRLAIMPVGKWSSRFAEGARVTVFRETGPCRGTVLPLMASGHIYGDLINTQLVNWDQVEIRIDKHCNSIIDLQHAGFEVGNFVAFDAMPELAENGFINARHLDDKAGVATLLAVIQSIIRSRVVLPVNCHFIFTIFEEVGSGASAVVHGDVAEMVSIDHAPIGSIQNASEMGVTIGMMDQTGPFDYHLGNKLAHLCIDKGIRFEKDVFRYYRSDSASAIEAGNDTRTALICFGVDGSHGYERSHISSLMAVGELIGWYIQSEPTFTRDKKEMTSLKGFPHQPERDPIQIKT
jgi:peptidase M42 family hydrolase